MITVNSGANLWSPRGLKATQLLMAYVKETPHRPRKPTTYDKPLLVPLTGPPEICTTNGEPLDSMQILAIRVYLSPPRSYHMT